jgi:hypothetical protein
VSKAIRTILVALMILSFSLCADAQSASSNKDYLRGLSKDELIKYLGKPDQVSTPSSNDVNSSNPRAEWRYGNSLVFLIDGKVTAWSDSGDLESRKIVSSLQPKGGRGRLKDTGLAGWKNAWEKEEEITSDEVVSELLEGPVEK